MRVETVIGLADQPAVEPLFSPPDLSPATSRIALRFVSKAKATLHSPSAALNRNSFMFAWRESYSVSTRGRPNCGPELLQQSRQRQNLRLHVLVQFVKLWLKLVANLNNPAHPHNMTHNPYSVSAIFGCLERKLAAR